MPMEQVLTGPRRAQVQFYKGRDDCRGFSDMLSGAGAPGSCDPEEVRARTGPSKSSRRKGWSSLGRGAYVAYQTSGNGPESRKLAVGRVVSNNPFAQEITVQPHRAVWGRTKLRFLPLFLETRDEGGRWTVEAAAGREPASAVVLYPALVLEVELLSGSELSWFS